jgi:hypothetical protein
MSDTIEQRKTSLLKELTSYERRDLNFARCHSWSAQIRFGSLSLQPDLPRFLGLFQHYRRISKNGSWA